MFGMVMQYPCWLACLSTAAVEGPSLVCAGNTVEVALDRVAALRVQTATDGGTQSAEEGAAPVALGSERRLMV